MDERDDLYDLIIEEYHKTGSVSQVAENLNTNKIKVRRVLITEGLWESRSSKQVGELFAQGMSVKEIAKELCMSEKNVQSYMPYTRGAYGGSKSNDAERSGEYRARQISAETKQPSVKRVKGLEGIKQQPETVSDNVVQFKQKTYLTKPAYEKPAEDNSGSFERFPSVLKLRFEMVSPYKSDVGKLDMNPEEEAAFLKNAKAEEGLIRDVLVHGQMNLHAIHYMIQRLFGWQNCHLHNYSLSEKDFDMVTKGQRIGEYLKLCGTIFRYPDAGLEDRFWDDDYHKGISVKSWLRTKYTYGYRDFSVDDTFIKNYEYVEQFKKTYKRGLVNPKMTLENFRRVHVFENSENFLLEGICVRDLFATAYEGKFDEAFWRTFMDDMIREKKQDVEEVRKESLEDYKLILDTLKDLNNLRTNILNIDKAIRFGQADDVQKFYNMNPYEVISSQKALVRDMEEKLGPYLADEKPKIFPFTDAIYYNYDYGDDWCVKITCLDAYTANDDYDIDCATRFKEIDGQLYMPKRIPWNELQYRDLSGKIVDDDLREKLQTVYLKTFPICVHADGINVMDDVGGVFRFKEFLEKINSTDPEDREEREELKYWAKGQGWTGRKIKPENML
ncbi:IS1096 element passenger TnpR family protein [Butyrivibrio sp.]|uniref:IS1096 element passenger TnpR family protein n=1 Tax=Butyrivibrio sp. TaxID=28121 RepID=UPI0025C72AD9|nr:hypothetical protein [Butyrivibrio sp.]MBE5838891.1 hypothetical protein [Butyrivibrio sp.]